MTRQIRKKSGTGIYQVLSYTLSFGAGVRQFSRLTGVSFGVIQKLKMITRTDPMILEIFHTFGFSHPKGYSISNGIMNYPPHKPSMKDALIIANSSFLPLINIKK